MKPTFNGIIIILAMILFAFVFYSLKPLILQKGGVTVNSSDTTIITLPAVTVTMPPQNITISPPTVMPSNIDTSAIILDYLSRVEYRDSIENDTVKITLHEFVSRNRVESRNMRYQLKMPVSTVINQIQPRSKLMVGGFLSVGRDCTLTVMPMVGIHNKRDRTYQLGYDFINSRIGVGVMIPIKLRR